MTFKVYTPSAIERLRPGWKVLALLRVILFVISLGGLRTTASSNGNEFRGIWVDAFGEGFRNEAEVRQLIQRCRKYNFNAVFVEMRRRGNVFYSPPAGGEPRAMELTNNFDALAEIIKQCHQGSPRIEVHCWIVSHLVWAWKRPPPETNHVFNRHPEFLTRDSLGQKQIRNTYYLDPGNPDANQYLHDIAIDIVRRYDIDGFHWDYCRYPERDSGYNPTAIRRYNEESGSTGQPEPRDPSFTDWRRRQVTDFLRWVNADILQIKPTLITSVAVFSDLNDARGHRFQNWPEWNREGLIDVTMPMAFATNNQHVFLPRLEAAMANRGSRGIYPGQGAYMNALETSLTQLQHIKKMGFGGSVFYSYRTPSNGRIDSDVALGYIRDHFQPNWQNTPILPWKRSKGIIKGVVTTTDTSNTVYNAIVTFAKDGNCKVRTEPHGAYAFFDLEPGNYTIIAGGREFASETKEVHVKAGQVSVADFVLGPTDNLSLQPQL